MRFSFAISLLLLGICSSPALSAERLEFTRMVAHWDAYADPGYLPFIEAAQPEIAQVGFYGAHFWSLAHTPHGKGYPAHFPEQGLAECGAWFEDLNRQLHRRGAKVVGHMNVKFLIGDPESKDGPRGFFKFYRELWDESQLSKRPVSDPLELLERDREGKPITNSNYSIGGMMEYWGCLNNPAWRDVLKAWTKVAIARGVDGLMINYFYRHDCHCRHCVAGFKAYLAERHSAEQLRERFAIADVAGHRFDEIVAWHDPAKSTPLRREMLRWSQIANKQAFDEVFVKYGRSLKPDLIVGQWNHLGDFNQISGDERCLLPSELWGKDEDYLWYSTGAAAHFTDLKQGFLGEGTLQARYIRGAFDDKPFTLGKYESTRTRVTIAELAANGGAPMGFYARFKDAKAREEIVRYYQFLKRYDELYRANRSHAEAVLLYPRTEVHEGDVGAAGRFKEVGKEMLDRHVLFDVLPDDLPSETLRPGEAPAPLGSQVRPGARNPFGALPDDRSTFTAPKTVRVSASRPAKNRRNEITLHFVNYNRTEPAQPRSAGRGIADENPIAVRGVAADLRLPSGMRVIKVATISPESPDPLECKFTATAGRVRFEMPEFLVYGVARVMLEKETQ
jgi:hypothetical protein